MLKKILIANRGEIALRIIRAAHELGIKTVAVYSEADRESLFVKLSDEAYCIGNSLPKESYLNMDKLLTVALGSRCDGIHPGYGFLSESFEFAKRVEDEGISFIGPRPETIRNMGNKSFAISTVRAAGVPTVPGSNGNIDNLEEAKQIASDIGYPVLLKAASGGGGKGIRRVNTEEEMAKFYPLAKGEAQASFSDDSLYLEKLILNPRHIEVQILADRRGSILCLGERNCSIQRDNQKMIEESPSPYISEQLRQKLYESAILAAKSCDYVNAGTVEFLVDDAENYYFIEMNTRIQVEHPVTEMVTGIDLIKEQIRIASGLNLRVKQEELKNRGHAIEVRIMAKDPMKSFQGDAGSVEFFHAPGGVDVRFESDLYTGVVISPYYDSMIGKLVVKDKTRSLAIKKLRRALEETMISGIKTNLWYLYTIAHDFDFIRGKYNTHFIEEKEGEFLRILELYYDKFLE